MTSMTRSTPSTPICNPHLPPPTETNAGALQPSVVRHVATPRPCLPPMMKPPLIKSGTTKMHFAFLRNSFVVRSHNRVQNVHRLLQTVDRILAIRTGPCISSNHAHKAHQ